MDQQRPKHVTLSTPRLIAGLTLAVLLAGVAGYWLLKPGKPQPGIVRSEPAANPGQAPRKPPGKPTVTPAPVKSVTKPVEKKPRQTPPPPAKPGNEFVIQGLVSTGGEPWAANMIMIKILWLKNKNGRQFMLGRETSMVQATANGFAYRIILKPQTSEFLNWNGGVEGNVGRVVAFVDHKRDGRLTLKRDKIIAVSKELVRYRTGRYDKNILNNIQQQNIQQAGKGYVIVRNVQIDDHNPDWQVVARKSPARLDLNASETSLPAMYNTFMKLQ